jgi:hypothetical protein
MEYTTMASTFLAFCMTAGLAIWVMGQDDWWKW